MSALTLPRSEPLVSTNSWSDADELELLTLLEWDESSRSPLSLREFTEKTIAFPLHDWQARFLCPLLERLRTHRGLRIALHGPPQFGKSLIVSQRLPAYLIGCDPSCRVGLACYNETHSMGFGQVVKDLMLGQEFAEAFPSPLSRVPKDAPAGRFATTARAARADAQPSFLAMGLLSGFTGKGVDHLIIDDPYKSADEAKSQAINEKVWRWWTQTAGPRIPDTANVICMFHRYHEDDFAGRLLAGGGWEYHRFPAIADANEDGSDPTGREEGELLSPMRSREWLEEQKARDLFTFLGQFQGTPRPDEGGFFKTQNFQYCEATEVPALTRECRAWDIAATEGAGDWTVGAKVGISNAGRYYITDVIRGRWSTDKRNAIIRQTAEEDGRQVSIHLPQDPGAAGKDSRFFYLRLLDGFSVKVEPVSGSKATRADPYSSQVNGGNVTLVRATWTLPFVNEHKAFLPDNKAGTDDQIDAASDAYTEIASKRVIDTVY